MPEPQENLDEQEDGRTGDRTGRLILIVVVLALLLLLCSCSAATLAYYRFGPQQAKFVVRNSECLVCHTELLAQMRMRSTHEPFVQRDCLSCHKEHTGLLRVTVTTGEGSTRVSMATWFRWGPFRHVLDSLQRFFTGTTSAGQTTVEKQVVGVSGLVAPPDRLCWMCHGNLGPERKMDFQHQPFAASHCTSCHSPHASNEAPLLIAAPYILCVTCHPMGAQLNRPQPHPPALQRRCLDCHRPHASNYEGVLVIGQRDLCFTCHPTVAVLSNDSVQHQPFLGDNCTGCHEPHGAYFTPLLLAPTPQLCYRCHTTIEARFDRVSHHPVPSQINCQNCHQPHASNFNALLLEPERELCMSCHTNIAMLTTLSVQHAPFAQQPCTSCHTPHGSSYAPLLINPVPNLCYMCHPKLATLMARPSHHPQECTRCHSVHAASHEFLLFADLNNNFCYTCHPTIASTYNTSLHKNLMCLKCHNAHGSKYKPLLAKNPPKVCTQCHDEHRFVGKGVMYLLKAPPDLTQMWTPADNAHRTSPRFLDIHSNKPLTCTSTCHNPHGSQYLHMTRNYSPEVDGLCLQCHKGVGKRF